MSRTKAWSILFIAIIAAPLSAQDAAVRVVVGFNGDPDPALVTGHGGAVVKVLAHGRAVVARMAPGHIAALRGSAAVSFVEEDVACSLVQQGPSAKGKPAKPSPPPPPQSQPWGITRIEANFVWGATTGAGVIVGISDTGIDTNHPDLMANYIGGVNNINETTNPEDDNGHGSHVSGTVAAVNNTIGVVGVAPGASLYAAKGLNRRGSGWSSDLAEGIDMCRVAGAKIISMSWGSSSESSLIAQAIARAHNAEILCVAASGNEGANSPGYPAATSGVLSVGATDINDNVPSWSNRNPDISAPGVSVTSTWKGDGYNTISGTSMATPHVSGVAALVRALFPALDRAGVESRLTSSAESVGSSTLYGAGIVNAEGATAP